MKRRLNLWVALILAAGIPRIMAAIFLPNAFGDAHVYIRDIGVMSTKLKAGTFVLTDLYGFWLPLYQFLSAVINVFVGNGFYTGKLVSALFGVGVCLFVYAITLQLVAHRTAALLAFALIALNPLHILNSASAMTDVPHAFFVLASFYFVLKRRWVIAAIFAALAGFARVESWMLLPLIPLIQFFHERRISIPSVLVMLVAPAFWFYVSWKATGDWLACFRVRQQYHDWLLQQNPALGYFSVGGVLKDATMFITSADIAVLLAAFAAAWMVLKNFTGRGVSRSESDYVRIVPLLLFFFAFFALLVGAYLTHQQPIIFPRYGLILFSLGTPILAWIYLQLARNNVRLARKLLISIATICILNASVQLVGSVGLLNQIAAQRAVADYLRDHFEAKSSARIFSDEGTVTVMSGIPGEKFLTSADAPKDRESFLKFLSEKRVEYLVVIKKADSTPARLFPGVESDKPEPFELVMHGYSGFLRTDIWLFRVRDAQQPLQNRER